MQVLVFISYVVVGDVVSALEDGSCVVVVTLEREEVVFCEVVSSVTGSVGCSK